LELVTVLIVLGALATVAGISMRPDLLGSVRARADAGRLQADLLRARRLAISSGDDHRIAPRTEARRGIVGYTVERKLPGGSWQPVEEPRDFPPDVHVTIEPRGAVLEFNFEGAALDGYRIALAGPTRRWELIVAQATGAVRVREF
jgi:hypothetical protein